MSPFLFTALLASCLGCATGTAAQTAQPEPAPKKFQMRTYCEP